MENNPYKNKKRLHIIPLVLGIYGGFLGLGLIAMGLVQIREGVGIIRFVLGLGMTSLGLFGIWDGVRDLIRPEKKAEKAPASQFVFTDTSGDRHSHITSELLREQLDILAQSEDYKSFHLQALPPLPVAEHGMLKQISCVLHNSIILVAFFETPEDGYRICQKTTDPDSAAKWLEQLLAGRPDFSEWQKIETDVPSGREDALSDEDVSSGEQDAALKEADTEPDAQTFFLNQLLADRKGQLTYWHKLLIIFGESWHDEHRFFSARDVELAVEGVCEGKYLKIALEWGPQIFELFPGVENDLTVIWHATNPATKVTRFLARTGTVTQVNFWLIQYLERGFFEDMSVWTDITVQIEKEFRKEQKKHGKIF